MEARREHMLVFPSGFSVALPLELVTVSLHNIEMTVRIKLSSIFDLCPDISRVVGMSSVFEAIYVR